MDDPGMVLCVDIGSSFVKYALASGRKLTPLGRQATRGAVLARSPWPTPFRREGDRIRQLDGVIVSSVVPSLNRPFAKKLERRTRTETVFVDHKLALPFKLRVADPGRVGVDRLCAAVGAARHGARAVIVVDVGSAITVDLVAHGVYRGGVILAGPEAALKGLVALAEQLPVVDYERATRSGLVRLDRAVRSTADSMVLGATLGSAGAIRATVALLEKSLEYRPRRFLTGGGAAPLVTHLGRSWKHDPHLVHRGLHHLWRTNFASHRRRR